MRLFNAIALVVIGLCMFGVGFLNHVVLAPIGGGNFGVALMAGGFAVLFGAAWRYRYCK